MSDKFLLPTSIIIAGLLIGGGVYLNGKITKTPNNNQSTEVNSVDLSQKLRKIDENDHVLGSLKSRIIIVEYSDTECPFCKLFHSTMLNLMQEYGKDGKVAWIYRHFPIAETHSNASKEAEALECAGELGGNSKFWEYTNRIYEVTPSNNNLDPLQLSKIATQVGLSSTAFDACLASGRHASKVQEDIKNATDLGALGTPYSIIIDTKNSQYYKIDGFYPYSDLKSAIDLILQS